MDYPPFVLRCAAGSLQAGERILDLVQVGVFSADHSLVFGALQCALIRLPGSENAEFFSA
jgi:hypothetical protein